jgi:hypothetical protein
VPLTRVDAQRWLDGFEQAARADGEMKRRQGPRPEWSITLALSLIQAARTAAGGHLPSDPRRTRDEEAVRQVWERLRGSLR